MQLRELIRKFTESKINEGLRPTTIARYGDLWKAWLTYADRKNLTALEDWTAETLERWRQGWPFEPRTHRLHLTQLRSIYRFAVEHGWLDRNEAKLLKPPKVRAEPVGPLTASEAKRLVLAAREHSPTIYAFCLVMLYGGLAIRDAATLKRSAIQGSLLTLRRAKSGEFVRVDLPSPVLDALDALPHKDRPHYFWRAQADAEGICKSKRVILNRLAKNVGIHNFHPHRLRHTFAVRLLGSGEITMEQLSTLMGHSSIQTTERYYASWDPTRQSLLVRKVRKANAKDTLLKRLGE